MRQTDDEYALKRLDDIAESSERQAVALEQIHYILQELADIMKERLGY